MIELFRQSRNDLALSSGAWKTLSESVKIEANLFGVDGVPTHVCVANKNQLWT